MRIFKACAAGAVALLVPAALALAATASPTGVYKGTLKFNDGHRASTFAIKATFKSGRLARLYGEGAEMPFVAKLSNTDYCGAANIYDSADVSDHGKYTAKVSGSVDRAGNFSFVLRGAFHDVTTFEGKFVSASKLSGKIRFYESHMPRAVNHKVSQTGHCDSGFLPLTLSK